ncbi:MAG: hypothetical protein U1E86_28350 [Burkholderiaceae bacterium]
MPPLTSIGAEITVEPPEKIDSSEPSPQAKSVPLPALPVIEALIATLPLVAVTSTEPPTRRGRCRSRRSAVRW